MSHSFRATLIVLLWAALLGASACKKDDPSPEASAKARLLGRWELAHTSGGYSGHGYPLDPARKQEVVFTAFNQALFLKNGAVTSTVRYSLSTGPAITGPSALLLTFSPAPPLGSSIISYLSASELVLSHNVYDGLNFHYIRR